jgi:hypothetical protein
LHALSWLSHPIDDPVRFGLDLQYLARMRFLFCFVVLLLVVSCGGGQAPSKAPPSATLTTDQAITMCVQLHQQGARCAPEFAKLNLELRAKYVPEFATALADPAQRAAIEAEAIEEIKADGGPAVTERCTEFAKPSWGPLTPRGDAVAADLCYRKVTCDERMSCLRPVIEPRYQYRAAQAAKPAQDQPTP